ncbi:SDR family oxidoreductase [Streptomyces sp. NBC_00846]|uniref:type I polyketide synthase n=1 Tax=Streptomyces sp. NBC_00846 TaxID=2975849 RepID=UPI00386C7C9E|nr:SDR family oxidoreductase [Streptomyces sp. NBC_00846]
MTEHPIEVASTDIALVGLSGRFPKAADAAELWANVRAGRSGVTRFTDEQLRAAGVAQHLLDDPDYVKAGAVVDGVDLFDAGFFGINPKEAQILDPQHRLFLEHSWHALEDAACDPARFDGSIGVFAGCAISSYMNHNLVPAGVAQQVGELAMGLANDKDSLPLRVAHALGLSGPAYGIQSYCSTSLVAVCAAATSLAAFECDLALAGGVAITVPGGTGYLYQAGGISSPDGECRAFDASGQGSLLGNGVGVVALRRLEDALEAGDRVYAVIRGWAVNNDAGRKVGFTAPGVGGQAEVVAEALAAAGLEPGDITYVEAHGTGTALGDAAELAALQQVFAGEELLLGSVKSNVGHLDRAAGVTGLIKAALALHHEEIPATLNHSTPNPQLLSGDARLEVVTENRPWPRGESPRRAGVSAFGIGGTNAHVVIEEAPERPVRADAAPSSARPELLVWSARTATAADEAGRRLAARLETEPVPLADVAHTLHTGRAVLSHRRALVSRSARDAARGIHEGAYLAGQQGRTDRPVTLYLPDGPIRLRDADELAAREPAFHTALDACRTAPGGAEPAGPNDTQTSFPVAHALTALLRSWGVTPAAYAGRGSGRLVADRLSEALPPAAALEALGSTAVAHTGSGDTLAELLADEERVLLVLGTADLSGLTAEQRERVVEALPETAADDGLALAEAVARLWLAGAPVDWDTYAQGRNAVRVGLPGYPFERRRYWIDPPAAPAGSDGTPQPARDGSAPQDSGHVTLLTPRWTPDEAGAAAADAGLTGRYALSRDRHGVADALAGLLRAAGVADVALVNEDAEAEAATAPAEGPLTVVHLASLDAREPGDAVLAVSRFLSSWAGLPSTDRVVLATRGARAVSDGESADPAQAALAALPVVAGQEYPGLDSRGVDLDPAAEPAQAAAHLLAELRRVAADPLTAYRSGRRHRPSYVPAAPEGGHGAGPAAETDGAVRAGGRYLITGGLGDVGLLVAGHLVRGGAGSVVLAGRSGLPDDPAHPRRRAVEELSALGAEVRAVRLDVTDEAAVRALFTDGGGTFDGVVHAAADTAQDTFLPLSALDEETVRRHFEAKVGGARTLRAVLRELPADGAPRWCVVFSSTSAHLGGLAFGGYAAANAALAAHAGGAAGDATRWISAAWDTWAPTLERLEGPFGAAMTAHAMTVEQALTAFDGLFTRAARSLVVAAGGLGDRLPRPAAARPTAPTVPAATFPRPELPQPYVSPVTATQRALAALWTEVLAIEPVGIRDNFFDLGGSSLLALQMLATVKERFGVAVPTVALFESPTVRGLAGVLDAGGPRPVSAAPAPAAVPGRPAAPVDAVPAARAEPSAPVARTATTAELPDADELDRRIAIIGMAGRFPGAGDVVEFWRNLCDGVESVTFFSPEELIEAGVDPDLANDPDYVPARPVLDDITGFDAGFFGMSPRMAALTDPQQRLFLEVCWEGLEHAGYAHEGYRDRVGVFGGSNLSTYLLGMLPQLVAEGDVNPYELIMSNDKDALTTSVSYLFNLDGPSVAVQTFCSTSLVAVHTAVRSLRAGECGTALAGGVSVAVPDRRGHLRQTGGMDSHDGHVHSFDAEATGTLFGDGATVVVLKRLSDALRDGDTVHAVIRGSALNNDGAQKAGYTAPSVTGQAAAVRAALVDAQVTSDEIGYVEAHGTATELGDPIEIAALTRAFGPAARPGSIPIGAVKTNIGHLNHAAGTAGLIKTALTVREGVVPASLNYTRPNPQIDFAGSPFYVNTGTAAWSGPDGRPRIAGLNSLGMGGTNVHVVVEEPPAPPARGPEIRRHHPLVLSARSEAAADQAVRELGEHLAAHPELRPTDVAFTLQAGRKVFEHRRAAVVGGTAHAAAVFSGEDEDTPVTTRVETVSGRPVAFLFAGVGEQYPGLVGDLHRHEPVFRAELDHCLDLLAKELPDVDLTGLLTGDRPGAGPDLAALLGRATGPADGREAELERTEVVQPLMFAVDHALARTFLAWGVRPSMMLGYSLGEYVAACLAGVLSLQDAIALVAHRARLIGEAERGSMVAVPLNAEQLLDRYGLAERGLDVAAVNGPSAVVVAGPGEALESLIADLARDSVPARPLRTTHAFHSRMLAPLAEQLTAWVAENVTLNPPALPYLSNVTGDVADAALVCDPGYWAAHMCRTVRFADAVERLLAEPELAMVEIGPGPSLGAMVRGADCPPQRWPLITATLPAQSDPRPADLVLTECVARLWMTGVDLDWAAYHGSGPATTALHQGATPGRVPLPTYPFQRQRYWIDPAPMPGGRAAPALSAGPLEEPTSFADLERVPLLPEEQWLWQPVWRQTAAPAPAEGQPGHWLVYTDGAAAERILAELRRAAERDGATVTAVRPGDGHTELPDGDRTVRPGSHEDALDLLTDLRGRGLKLERVVHLWTLGDIDADDDESTDDETVRRGLHTVVALARAADELGRLDWELDLVTAGVHQVLDGTEVRPAAATLVGPSLVVPLEYPGISTRLIDALPGVQAASVAAELRRPRADLMVALRGARRWVPRYESLHPADPEAVAEDLLREEGVYLITGGLGGIGLAMAERLARSCRARLVLMGRRGLPPRERWEAIASGAEQAEDAVRERVRQVLGLLALGAQVEIVGGDAADPRDMRRAVGAAQERFGALHGVLHAAGVAGTGLIQFKEPEDSELVLAPKVAGLRALTEALGIGGPDETELDFLVLFSSITSATGGGPGQVDYCAANAYLDAAAARLAQGGRRVVSISWGEWTWNAWDFGLAGYDDELQSFFRQHRATFGIGFDEGWRCLLRALATGEPRVVVSTQDLPTIVRYSTGFTVEAVLTPAVAGTTSGTRHPRPDLLTPYRQPEGPAEEAVAGVWCEHLKLESVGSLDNFFELGGSSLLGIAVLAQLRRSFPDAELPPRVLYEAPTVEALARVVQGVGTPVGPVGHRTA